MQPCHSCGKLFPDFQALAIHIVHEKKGHRKGKIWAKRYVAQHVMINTLSPGNRRDHAEKSPTTAQDKINKEDCRRELSGGYELVPTICPKCKTKSQAQMPVEHSQCEAAWRIGGRLAVLCVNCDSSRSKARYW